MNINACVMLLIKMIETFEERLFTKHIYQGIQCVHNICQYLIDSLKNDQVCTPSITYKLYITMMLATIQYSDEEEENKVDPEGALEILNMVLRMSLDSYLDATRDCSVHLLFDRWCSMDWGAQSGEKETCELGGPGDPSQDKTRVYMIERLQKWSSGKDEGREPAWGLRKKQDAVYPEILPEHYWIKYWVYQARYSMHDMTSSRKKWVPFRVWRHSSGHQELHQRHYHLWRTIGSLNGGPVQHGQVECFWRYVLMSTLLYLLEYKKQIPVILKNLKNPMPPYRAYALSLLLTIIREQKESISFLPCPSLDLKPFFEEISTLCYQALSDSESYVFLYAIKIFAYLSDYFFDEVGFLLVLRPLDTATPPLSVPEPRRSSPLQVENWRVHRRNHQIPQARHLQVCCFLLPLGVDSRICLWMHICTTSLPPVHTATSPPTRLHSTRMAKSCVCHDDTP